MRIKSADGAISRELVSDAVLSIGRLTGADICLKDERVSRQHARIFARDGAFYVEDVGSHAGTFVNERRIDAPVRLSAGDVIRCGGSELSVVESPSPAANVEAPASASSAVLPLFSCGDGNGEMYSPAILVISEKICSKVLEMLNISIERDLTAGEMQPKVEEALDRAMLEMRHLVPASLDFTRYRQVLLDDLIGLGPLSELLRNREISEIMINGPNNIFVELKGLQYRAAMRFSGEAQLQSIIQRIVEPLGRHIDSASPMVDARLKDGSRVNAVIPPLALDGSLVTIRKFPDKKLSSEDLEGFGSLTRPMSLFLKEAVRARKNILVSGGTGSGKTTLLNILSQFIPEKERVITVEDSAELKLSHENLCRLEARPANVEGKGRVTIRDLVINTLRMRPDRIIVGECRGAEALDMLQAMNTGHDGSMTTCHANNPRDALSRLENMVMMAGFELPSSAIREQIASAIDIIVQQTRLPDGSRKIVKITEITGMENGTILMQDIFSFEQDGFDENFRVTGHHTATGNIPRFVDDLRQSGDLQLDMSVFVPES
ncbi:MAG: Flp pilus assembly complex ATPase component TadA [Victivallaceae bacterium]|nr:Flp pilus assembly complex ATPase component TadA [Victivallaceae bacterium]